MKIIDATKDTGDLSEILSEDLVTLTYSNNLYTVYLDEDIGSPSEYRKFINLMQSISHNDTIKIIFNTMGGNTFTGIQLMNEILKCPAYVIGEIYSAYSAGADISMACDELVINSFSSMMFHSLSWGVHGKVHEMKSHSDFAYVLNEQTANKMYETFLTTKEIETICKGEDVWLQYNDIKKRIKKWKPLKIRIANGEATI